ncbi:MAG: hypothetical protein AAB091_05820, partial [Elusimicrobiota bacterium]
MERELQEELLDYARRRYHSEKRSLMDLLDLKEKEVGELRAGAGLIEEKLRNIQMTLDNERAQSMVELSARAEELKSFETGMRREQDAYKR